MAFTIDEVKPGITIAELLQLAEPGHFSPNDKVYIEGKLVANLETRLEQFKSDTITIVIASAYVSKI